MAGYGGGYYPARYPRGMPMYPAMSAGYMGAVGYDGYGQPFYPPAAPAAAAMRMPYASAQAAAAAPQGPRAGFRPPYGMMPSAPVPAPVGPVAKYYSLDVECVAIGPGHNDRAVAQIALVDQYERVLLNVFVRPPVPVVSFLTPLTGLTPEHLEQGIALVEALAALRQMLPSFGVLVGQNIAADIRWLGLKEGVDFESLIDLSGAYRVFNPKFNNFSFFSLQHEARVVLGISMDGPHNAVTDALVSIKLLTRYFELQEDKQAMDAAKQALLAMPPEPSFAKKNPSFEGVCMGNKKTCSCKQPFLY